MQMLTIENLSKSKDRTYLLKDVTLGIQAGEILGLLGLRLLTTVWRKQWGHGDLPSEFQRLR